MDRAGKIAFEASFLLWLAGTERAQGIRSAGMVPEELGNTMAWLFFSCAALITLQGSFPTAFARGTVCSWC